MSMQLTEEIKKVAGYYYEETDCVEAEGGTLSY